MKGLFFQLIVTLFNSFLWLFLWGGGTLYILVTSAIGCSLQAAQGKGVFVLKIFLLLNKEAKNTLVSLLIPWQMLLTNVTTAQFSKWEVGGGWVCNSSLCTLAFKLELLCEGRPIGWKLPAVSDLGYVHCFSNKNLLKKIVYIYEKMTKKTLWRS